MAEAYICDFARTPIGRYGGSLKDIRTDDLAAHPLRVLRERNPQVDWAALDDVLLGCANQAGEDNRNVARMATPAGRLSGRGAGRHHQPAVRLGPGCGRHRRARHPRRRGGADPGRRRREHDPRAVRHGQGRRGVQPQRRDLRHHHRLALRQPGDEGGLRHRLDAGDRRERRRGVPGLARRPGRVRLAQPATRRARAAGRVLRPRDRAGDPQGPQGRHGGRHRRASPPRHHAGGAGEAEDRRSARPGTVTAGNASGVNDGAAALLLASEDAARSGTA